MKFLLILLIAAVWGSCNEPAEAPQPEDNDNGAVTSPGSGSAADSFGQSHPNDTTSWEGATNDTSLR